MKIMRKIAAFALILFTFVLCETVLPVTDNPMQANPLAIILPLLLTAISTAAQYSSQNKAQKQTQKYQSELENRRTDYENWFKGEYNKDFLDTEQGKAAANQMGATLKNTLDRNQSGAVRGGTTVEGQVAAQGGALDSYAQALNQLTSQGTQYKQSLRNSYDYNIQNYLRPLDQFALAGIANTNALGGQYGDSASGLITALGQYDWNQTGQG